MIDSEAPSRMTLMWRYVVLGLLLLPAVYLKAHEGLWGGEPKIVVFASTLPGQVGAWEGESMPLTEDEESLLQSPASAQKVYSNALTRERVQVLLLQVNNTQNAHDPKICMRGSGYDLESEKEVVAPWVGKSGKPYPVTRAVFRKGQLTITMYYWIQTSTGTIADMSTGLKWAGVVRAFGGQSTKGVAVRVVCLPFADNLPTRPEAGEQLWKDLNQSIDLEKLVTGM
jgi:EpsI family protein